MTQFSRRPLRLVIRPPLPPLFPPPPHNAGARAASKRRAHYFDKWPPPAGTRSRRGNADSACLRLLIKTRDDPFAARESLAADSLASLFGPRGGDVKNYDPRELFARRRFNDGKGASLRDFFTGSLSPGNGLCDAGHLLCIFSCAFLMRRVKSLADARNNRLRCFMKGGGVCCITIFYG